MAAGKDYEMNDYSRLDFIIQPEVGVFVPFARRLSLAFGIGVMSHYYLPILNVGLGVTL